MFCLIMGLPNKIRKFKVVFGQCNGALFLIYEGRNEYKEGMLFLGNRIIVTTFPKHKIVVIIFFSFSEKSILDCWKKI